jgi:hypothetical protein
MGGSPWEGMDGRRTTANRKPSSTVCPSRRFDWKTSPIYENLRDVLRKTSSNSKSEIEIFGKVVPLNKICDIAVAVT